MTWGGSPAVIVSWLVRVMVTGKRLRASFAASEMRVAAIFTQVCVATASPAARPAARRKYCIRSARL
eukprot:857983-Lingulodinium_polyedra.AAC.1